MDKLDRRHGVAEGALTATYLTLATYYYYVPSLRLSYSDWDGVLLPDCDQRGIRVRERSERSDVVRIVRKSRDLGRATQAWCRRQQRRTLRG